MNSTEISMNPNELVQFLKKSPENFTSTDLTNFSKEYGIQVVNFRYVAEDGRLKTLNFFITSEEYLKTILTHGERVDGSSLFSFVEAGSSDLYRATGNTQYIKDAKQLSDASFGYFANTGEEIEGYYTFDVSGFRNWFNGVLLRAYIDVYPSYSSAGYYIESFQKNLDYGYDNFLYNGFLPSNLLKGWDLDTENNNTEGMFSFAFAAKYAVLARYELEKED